MTSQVCFVVGTRPNFMTAHSRSAIDNLVLQRMPAAAATLG
jgi:hypothetical protein